MVIQLRFGWDPYMVFPVLRLATPDKVTVKIRWDFSYVGLVDVSRGDRRGFQLVGRARMRGRFRIVPLK